MTFLLSFMKFSSDSSFSEKFEFFIKFSFVLFFSLVIKSDRYLPYHWKKRKFSLSGNIVSFICSFYLFLSLMNVNWKESTRQFKKLPLRRPALYRWIFCDYNFSQQQSLTESVPDNLWSFRVDININIRFYCPQSVFVFRPRNLRFQ